MNEYFFCCWHCFCQHMTNGEIVCCRCDVSLPTLLSALSAPIGIVVLPPRDTTNVNLVW